MRVGFNHLVLLLTACLAASCVLADEPPRIVVKGLFKDTAVLVINGKQRLVKAGKTSPEGVKLIAADSKRAIIEINGERSEHALGGHIGSRFRAAPETVAVRIYPSPRGMYDVLGSINGRPVRFLVDTGATSVAMNRREAKRLGIDYLVSGEPGFSSTASGIAKTYRVRLKKVRVGEIELNNVQGAVIDGDFPTEVLLGLSFLNRLNMQRDGRVLELRKKF